MELQFPADAHDALVRSGRNISDTERGGGHADGALRPVTPSWAGLDAGVPRRFIEFGLRSDASIANHMSASAPVRIQG